MLRDISSTTLTPREARGGRTKRRPIATLRPGDRVIVNLKGRKADRVHQWAGEVLAVDGVAIRLQPE